MTFYNNQIQKMFVMLINNLPDHIPLGTIAVYCMLSTYDLYIMHTYKVLLKYNDNDNNNDLYIETNSSEIHQEESINNMRHRINHIVCSCQGDCIKDIVAAGIQPLET